MSVSKMIPCSPDANINAVVDITAQNLHAQGFEVIPSIIGPQSASLNVKKDRDGFKNIIGLGIECNTTIVMNGNSINVNIDHEWTNKIIAIAIGWFVCFFPFITGIVGCVNQNGLPEKIVAALMAAANSGPMPGSGFNQYQQSGYAQPPVGGMNAQPPMQTPPQAPQQGGEYIPPQQ